MSGLAPEPPASGPHGPSSASPDTGPESVPVWSDTREMDMPPQPAPVFNANPPDKGADQLPTIGHIGRYALKYQIGEGGLGRVYAAHDPLLSRLIAIKTLNLEIAADERESFNALFLNEARAAGGLSHPHIVTVFDAGVSDQGAYIAMEMLKGRDLRQLRLEGWKPTPTQAALIVRRVSDALAYAHSKGVVHRDIKPANIFMVGRTQPRVLDFGIARIAHQHEHHEGDIAGGSPYYMAPEQVRQQAVDRRCDVFSLGVVLYELLTGARPFRGASLKEITDAVVEFDPPRANEVDESVPKALADIAARAMEKNPEDRYRSARALARELRHWLEEHAQETAEAGEEAPAAPSKRPLVLALGGVAAVLLAGAIWWGMTPNEAAPATSINAEVAPPKVQAVTPAPAASTEPSLALTDAASAPSIVAAAAPASGANLLVLDVAASAPVNASLAPVPAVAIPPTAPPAPPSVADTTRTAQAKPVAPKETPKERRAREAKERESKQAPAIVATGTLRIAVSPWGQVEVDGKSVGIAPPLNELTLAEGRHTITIRNDEFPPFSSTVQIVPGQPVSLKHRFGS